MKKIILTIMKYGKKGIPFFFCDSLFITYLTLHLLRVILYLHSETFKSLQCDKFFDDLQYLEDLVPDENREFPQITFTPKE